MSRLNKGLTSTLAAWVNVDRELPDMSSVAARELTVNLLGQVERLMAEKARLTVADGLTRLVACREPDAPRPETTADGLRVKLSQVMMTATWTEQEKRPECVAVGRWEVRTITPEAGRALLDALAEREGQPIAAFGAQRTIRVM